MLAHVCCKNHVYHHLAESLSLLFAKVGKDITILILQQFEGHSQMMVLKHRFIVIHEGELRGGVDQVLVCEAWVVHVVDGGCEDGSQDF